MSVTISDTIRLTNGSVATSGTVLISWPFHMTQSGASGSAGSTTVTIGSDGAFSVMLEPSTTATPVFQYDVKYTLPGETREEHWQIVATDNVTSIADAIAGVAGTGVSPVIPISQGGTGSTTASGALTALGAPALTGDNTFTGATAVSHLGGILTLPVSATAEAGAGTSPTISVTGGDLSFTVTLTTGTSPAAGNVFTINWATEYNTSNLPRCFVAPANAAAASAAALWPSDMESDHGTFDVNTALTASTQYVWNILATF